jgi:hypothetical protein
VSLVKEQAAFLLDVCKLVQYATSLGFVVTGGELSRPIEMQELYVKTGRSRTMKSWHLRRLAIDLNFFKDGKLHYDLATLRPLGEYWESLSPQNRWGGNFDRDWSKADSFVDSPHFERRVPGL